MTSNTLELVVGTTLTAISVGFMGGAWFLTWLFEKAMPEPTEEQS